ncbi:MAG: HAD-IIB family hydrolase [Acetobacteraceae bacterium]|nr:HAD-IIB family hydrolase [Acetobacteraceae bacterium]
MGIRATLLGMHYAALGTDYDGTLAHDGIVDEATIAALEKLRAAQRRLILVTGRELEDLQRVMPRLDLFDRVVAENGALLYRPDTREERTLADPPPPRFVARLREAGVQPLSAGRVIVATWEPNETTVLESIHALGLELQIIFNKGAVMVLPAGIHKGTGLAAALGDLELSAIDCAGVGDAENDNAFLSVCGLSVAVANALPALKESAAIVTEGARGAGVAELIERLLKDDPTDLEPRAARQRVPLAGPADGGEPLFLTPRRDTLLLAGASGGGKSTLALGLLERLGEAGFQYCVIDPEGDYESSLPALALGTPETSPEIHQAMEVLRRPGQSAVINLLALPLADRPRFFAALLPELLVLRARTSRPHFILVDEAHHMLASDLDPVCALLSADLTGFMFITVHPDRLPRQAVESATQLLIVGAAPGEAAAAFCRLRHSPCPPAGLTLEAGQACALRPGDALARKVHVLPATATRRRHLRKYAEGKLGDDKSFYFRGPDGRLNLRAHNLSLFVQLADGVDLETWEHHRRAHDYSRWIETAIKDPTLAEQVAGIERSDVSSEDARRRVREAIEAKYTAPA